MLQYTWRTRHKSVKLTRSWDLSTTFTLLSSRWKVSRRTLLKKEIFSISEETSFCLRTGSYRNLKLLDLSQRRLQKEKEPEVASVAEAAEAASEAAEVVEEEDLEVAEAVVEVASAEVEEEVASAEVAVEVAEVGLVEEEDSESIGCNIKKCMSYIYQAPYNAIELTKGGLLLAV